MWKHKKAPASEARGGLIEFPDTVRSKGGSTISLPYTFLSEMPFSRVQLHFAAAVTTGDSDESDEVYDGESLYVQ